MIEPLQKNLTGWIDDDGLEAVGHDSQAGPAEGTGGRLKTVRVPFYFFYFPRETAQWVLGRPAR